MVGAIVAFHPDRLTAHVDLFTTPSVKHLVEALVVSTLAFAGIEAASDLAPDFSWRRRDLRRVVGASAMLLPVIYAGMAAIALMAVPVVETPHGPQTALGGEVHRGADPGGGPELRPALVVGAAADRSGGDRADGPDVGGGDVDARPLAARVRAGHKPAGAELAGQAQSAVDALHRDPDRRGDRVRARAPDRRGPAGRDLRVRGDPRDRDRARLDPVAPLEEPEQGQAVPHPLQRPVPGEGDPDSGGARRGADVAPVAGRDRVPRPRSVGRGRVDVVRPDRRT